MSCSKASVDAVADAARAGDLDGLADVEGEVGRRNEAEPELARMQRDRHVLGEEVDDLHVAGIVPARDQVVLGLDEIERDHLRLGADQRRREGGLQEHVLERSCCGRPVRCSGTSPGSPVARAAGRMPIRFDLADCSRDLVRVRR